MTDEDTEDGYTYEPSIAEQGIRSLVQKAAQRDYSRRQIQRAVKEMLQDQRVAKPTEQQLDHEGAAREMSVAFDDRLAQAEKRLNNAEKEQPGTTGVEVFFDHVDEGRISNDGRPIGELLPAGDEAEVAAIVQKVTYSYNNGPQVESEYPLVMVGEYPVCTCPDRHYNRRDGGTCYHELAYDFLYGKRNPNDAAEGVTVRI